MIQDIFSSAQPYKLEIVSFKAQPNLCFIPDADVTVNDTAKINNKANLQFIE